MKDLEPCNSWSFLQKLLFHRQQRPLWQSLLEHQHPQDPQHHTKAKYYLKRNYIMVSAWLVLNLLCVTCLEWKLVGITSTLKEPIWNPVKPSLTVSTNPPVEATIGTYHSPKTSVEVKCKTRQMMRGYLMERKASKLSLWCLNMSNVVTSVPECIKFTKTSSNVFILVSLVLKCVLRKSIYLLNVSFVSQFSPWHEIIIKMTHSTMLLEFNRFKDYNDITSHILRQKQQFTRGKISRKGLCKVGIIQFHSA